MYEKDKDQTAECCGQMMEKEAVKLATDIGMDMAMPNYCREKAPVNPFKLATEESNRMLRTQLNYWQKLAMETQLNSDRMITELNEAKAMIIFLTKKLMNAESVIEDLEQDELNTL